MPALFALCVAGCAENVDSRLIQPPASSTYLADGAQRTLLAARGAPGQRLIAGGDVSGTWWDLLGSSELDALIRQGLEHNADVLAQEAAIRAAQAAALAQHGALIPAVNANYNVTRQLVPSKALTSNAASGASIYSIHTAQLTVSYAPDVFGGTRRLIEIAELQVLTEQLKREAVILTLTSSIVLAAIQEASLRGQIGATKRLVESQDQVLTLLRKQESAGQIGSQDVLAQETALAQARMLLPPLEKQLGQQRNLLAVLTGRFTRDALDSRFDLRKFRLPRELPVSVPGDLVRQRPDIAVAETAVRAANAQVGVAIANRLPQIKLSGNAGSAAAAFASLFTSGTHLWLAAADAVQPIFDQYALHYKQKAAEEQLTQAVEQYRGVVLVAFQNVADALLALDADAKALAAAITAEQAAEKSLQLQRKQLEQGQISLPNLLAAQQAYLQTSLARVQAEAARLADTVALFQALGGGWWNREQLASVDARQAGSIQKCSRDRC